MSLADSNGLFFSFGAVNIAVTNPPVLVPAITSTLSLTLLSTCYLQSHSTLRRALMHLLLHVLDDALSFSIHHGICLSQLSRGSMNITHMSSSTVSTHGDYNLHVF